LVKIIVSHTTFYIVSFNALHQAIQNGSFVARIFWGEPFDMEPYKNNMQTTLTPIGRGATRTLLKRGGLKMENFCDVI